MRVLSESYLHNQSHLQGYGLNVDQIYTTVNYVYNVLDSIDQNLVEANTPRFAKLVELANLSSMIGNLFRSGLIKYSEGLFKENLPHTFPDLLSTKKGFPDLEIKVALETNKPKGHLVKPGSHLVIRYVLGDQSGRYIRGKDNRSDVAWIWQIAIGEILEDHFSVSNTAGDSGKTAVINQHGMNNLVTIFFDPRMFPYSIDGVTFNRFRSFFRTNSSI